MDLARLLRSGALGAAAAGGGAPKPLAQLKCGRCNFDRVERGTKMRLSADPRRGELRVVKDAQGISHLQWKDRSSGDMGLDLEVFPGDVSFRRISAPVPSDRIYELKFTQGGRREFFWSQEPKEAAEAELIGAVLLAVNNTQPPTTASAGGGLTPEMLQQMISGLVVGGGGAAAAARSTAAVPPASSAPSAAAVPAATRSPAVMSGAAPAPTTVAPQAAHHAPAPAPSASAATVPVASVPAPAPPPLPQSEATAAMVDSDDADLLAALAMSMNDAPEGGAPPDPVTALGSTEPKTAAPGSAAPEAQVTTSNLFAGLSAAMASLLPANAIGSGPGSSLRRGFSANSRSSAATPLAFVMQPDEIICAIREDTSIAEALLEHLPPGQRTLEDLIEIIRSPQLRQAMGSLSGAMDSSNCSAVFSNFGLNAADGGEQLARGDGTAALVHAVQARADRVRAAAAIAEGHSHGGGDGAQAHPAAAAGLGSGPGSDVDMTSQSPSTTPRQP